MHTKRNQSFIQICRVTAGLTFLTILLAITGIHLPVLSPMGNFLFRQFHFAAFYIPGIFLFAVALIRSNQFSRRIAGLLWFSSLPFLTGAMMFQIMANKTQYLAPGLIINELGNVAGSILFFLLLVIQTAIMIKMASNVSDIPALLNKAKAKAKMNRIMEKFGLSTQETAVKTENAGKVEVAPEVQTVPVPEVQEAQEMQVPGEPPWPVSVLKIAQEAAEPVSASAPEPVALTPIPANNEPPPHSLYNLLDEENGEEEQEEVIDISQLLKTQTPSVSDADAWGEISGEDAMETAVAHAPEYEEPLEHMPGESPSQEREIQDAHVQKSTPSTDYILPSPNLLHQYPDSDYSTIDEASQEGARILERTLKEFKIEAKVTGICKGPVITMYEIFPSPGVKLSSIMNLQDNIALQLAASSVRIVAPIPGKHAVGIEVPNKNRTIVSFRSLMESADFHNHKAEIPVVLGKDLGGGNEIMDLTRTPHLLIAGATGSGKSVCVNTLISSILYSRRPDEVRMIMVDPKIVELKLYNDIPHLLTPVITHPKQALKALQWCLMEMERRYQLLDRYGVRNISSYNQRFNGSNEWQGQQGQRKLPYIVVIVDEFADLMVTSGKQLEGIVARLAAMSRAVGIHLVLATQRPSVDVITGLIKANFPSRIAFMVAAKTDSRIIIDSMGAEKLLGRGDMLFVSSWHPFPKRIQGTFMSEEDAQRLSDYIKTLGTPDYLDEEIFMDEENESTDEYSVDLNNKDPQYDEALELVLSSGKASASYLQRRLKLGYNRAARLIEEMERQGILGPANGPKPREILLQQT